MRGEIRCVEGRSMRHDPQHDDPDLETDMGRCPVCEGGNCHVDMDALADRLEQLGRFEIIRTVNSDGPRSAQVWLTEAERDAIVEAVRAFG